MITQGGFNDTKRLWAQIARQQAQRRGADDSRKRRVLHGLHQQLLGVGAGMSACIKRLAIMPSAFALRPIPLDHCVGGPLGCSTDMAVGAGIGRADLHRQVRPRHAKAMITPAIDDHIEALDHVTGDTLCGFGVRLVEVMLRPVVCGWQMTLCAQRIALGAQVTAVGLMAIRAGDSRLIHLALQERPILVHLIADLAVSVVERFIQERHAIALLQGLTGLVIAPDLRTSSMTAPAGLHLGAGRRRLRASCNGFSRRKCPDAT